MGSYTNTATDLCQGEPSTEPTDSGRNYGSSARNTRSDCRGPEELGETTVLAHSQRSTLARCDGGYFGRSSSCQRPRGDSTGGLISFIGGPELIQGLPGRMSIVGWRTWKLKRKAISTNDGEIQAMLEGEESNFPALHKLTSAGVSLVFSSILSLSVLMPRSCRRASV